MLELGYAYLSSLGLPEIAQPHLQALAEQVHESSSVSVLDRGDVVYVARAPAQRIMAVSINVGTRFPAHATSMGRVLLAHLDSEQLASTLDGVELVALTDRTITSAAALRDELERVRRSGWALVDQELERGLRSVAVPLRAPGGEVVAAINVSTHASTRTLEEVRRDLLPALQRAAGAIEADLAAGRRQLPAT